MLHLMLKEIKMTVKELIKQLEQLPEDLQVVEYKLTVKGYKNLRDCAIKRLKEKLEELKWIKKKI